MGQIDRHRAVCRSAPLAARDLAKTYGGDPNSADSQHYGRLAGFTNQKPKHTRAGRQPYVLAHDCSGQVAAAAPAYLQRIERHMDKAAAQQVRQQRLEACRSRKRSIGHAIPWTSTSNTPSAFWRGLVRMPTCRAWTG